MRVIILGSGAGGGIPQWNALNANGRRAFAGDPLVPHRMQCSLAVSADGDTWLLLNASPDLRQQILRTPQLHPRVAPRSSPIAAVVLTGGEIDQVTGLLCLRERQRFALLATQAVHAALAANPLFRALDPATVERRPIAAGTGIEIAGLTVTAHILPGKEPLYLEGSAAKDAGHTIGITVAQGGHRVVFAPGCARIDDDVRKIAAAADLLFFDGTLFTDDEMIASGDGSKTGQRMGHVSMRDVANAGLSARRKFFIHINNTNPVCAHDAPERRTLAAAGWGIAEDGMEFRL